MARSADEQQREQSDAAERAVLGTCLVSPGAFLEAAQGLRATHFRKALHKAVWRALEALAAQGKPFDLPLVQAALGPADAADLVALAALVDGAVKGANIRWHADRVAAFALLRDVAGILDEGATRARGASDDELDAVLTGIEAGLLGVRGGAKRPDIVGPGALADRAEELLEQLAGGHGVMGLTTGLFGLDKSLRGLHPGTLVIVGGRPSMGKSSLAYFMAVAGAKSSGKAALFLSLEMGLDEVLVRHLTIAAGVDHWRLTNGRLTPVENRQVLEELQSLRESALHVVDLPAASVGQVLALSRQMARGPHGLAVIVVDYLQLMTYDGGGKKAPENRTQEVGAVALAMKNLARELQVPVVLLSQLSRGVEARADKRPMLSDLRESGDIEAHADVVVLVYRPAYYFEGKFPAHLAELIVAKNRNGATGVVQSAFIREQMRFADWTDR
jgi:replicative DNA helicase